MYILIKLTCGLSLKVVSNCVLFNTVKDHLLHEIPVHFLF